MSAVNYQPVLDAHGRLLEQVQVDGYPITIYPPTTTPYHRIRYHMDGKRYSTNCGKNFNQAKARVADILDQIDSGTVHSGKPISTLIDAWLDPSRPRAREWSLRYQQGLDYLDRVYLRPKLGQLRCRDLRGRHLQPILDSAPSESEAKRIKRVLGSMLRWGYDAGYLPTPAEKLLGHVHWQGESTQKVTAVGEDPMAVAHEAIPTHQAVEDLRVAIHQLPDSRPHDALMVALAAYSGLRLGEILELRASDIDTSKRRIKVRRQWLDATTSPGQVSTPKWGKTRTTIYPIDTPAGYALAAAVRARVRQVSRQDPDGLMFPAPRGGHWVQRNFYARRFDPACEAAGWPMVTQTRRRRDGKAMKEKCKAWTFHSLRHVFCTWLLWECEASPADVAKAAGHASPETTLRVYANDLPGTLERLGHLTG